MRFSLIIPVYNVAPWLRVCLDSVRAQTFADFECVCVDDGSTDGSGAILDEYAARDVRFKVIHQPNGGEGAARNAGLDIAQGEWICFLDADDVLNERALEAYDRGIRAAPAAELVAIGKRSFADGQCPEWTDGQDVRWTPFDCGMRVPVEIYQLALWENAYRSDLIAGLRFGGLRIGADRVFVSQVLERVRSALITDWIGYGYRQRAGSACSSRCTAESLLDELRHYSIDTGMIVRSSKTYDPLIARQRAQRLVECFAEAYYRLPARERDRVWDAWLAEMDAVSGMKGVRPYMRAVMRIVVRTRSKALARTLIYGILWLKLHGVNRRLVVRRK